MVHSLLLTVRQLINAYLFLCFIRILLSWVPSAAYSSFGKVLSSICDPYLNWFRRFKFIHCGTAYHVSSYDRYDFLLGPLCQRYTADMVVYRLYIEFAYHFFDYQACVRFFRFIKRIAVLV